MERLFEVGDDAGAGEAPAPAPDAPLPVRLRPRSIEEVVGQEHVLGAGSALRTAIEAGRPHSMILHGPPGSGKTTLARLLAAHAPHAFEELSAVAAGRAEVRGVIERARARRQATGQGTILFLDEIHRFNTAQQDALLPAVEDGLVVLVGATTENPWFEINRALLSRCRVYALEPLDAHAVRLLLGRAREDGAVAVPDAVLDFLAERAGGDARRALAGLELVVATAAQRGVAEVGLADAEDAMQRRVVAYDKGRDQHFDYASAWIKATRGSDPDASLYYLAVMLEGGEDPRFIARRMVILASEDVGNADPHALPLAVAAAHAVEHVGLPECSYALAQAAVYLALAPKSHASGRALHAAREHVRAHGAAPPPPYLRAGHPAERAGGVGVGYDNPHGRPGHVSAQELMPPGLEGMRFYAPDEAEAPLRERGPAARRPPAGRRPPDQGRDENV